MEKTDNEKLAEILENFENDGLDESQDTEMELED